MRQLKVYGWNSFVDGNVQVRKIIAARSWIEACRLSGDRMSTLRHAGSITGNAQEIERAMSKPGAVFYVPLNEAYKSGREYLELPHV